MADEFDFSALDELADPTVLLDAMREAGAAGVREVVGQLDGRIADLDRRIERMEQAERSLQAAEVGLFWSQGKYVLLWALVACLVGIGIGGGYHWAREPKIEKQAYGCTRWDAKARTCRGEWIPLIAP